MNQTTTPLPSVFDIIYKTPEIKAQIALTREIDAQKEREWQDFQSKPFVGYGCTVILYSDRHAATITRVSSSGKSFWYRRDKATRIDDNGMSDCQTYKYESNPDSSEVQVRMTKKGWKDSNGHIIHVGYRREYYDYSF